MAFRQTSGRLKLGRPLPFAGVGAFAAHRTHCPRVDMTCFTAYSCVAGDGLSRFGVVVSRRLGGAVQRNRAKRRLRAAYTAWRQAHPAVAPLAVVLYAKAAVLTEPFVKIEQELATALGGV